MEPHNHCPKEYKDNFLDVLAHHHHHASTNILLALILNVLFTAGVFIGGYYTNSSAIFSEGVHNLGCTLSLFLAWVFEKVSTRAANDRYTFGYYRYSLCGTLLNGLVLTAGSVLVIIHTLGIMEHDHEHDLSVDGMLFVAVGGILFKFLAVLTTRHGHDSNERLVNLHLMSDAFGWIALLLASAVLKFVEIQWLDPVLSILIAVYVLVGVIKNFYDSVIMVMEATPHGVCSMEVGECISNMKGVEELVKLRLWSLSEHVACGMVVVRSSFKNETDIAELRSQIALLLQNNNISDFAIEID